MFFFSKKKVEYYRPAESSTKVGVWLSSVEILSNKVLSEKKKLIPLWLRRRARNKIAWSRVLWRILLRFIFMSVFPRRLAHQDKRITTRRTSKRNEPLRIQHRSVSDSSMKSMALERKTSTHSVSVPNGFWTLPRSVRVQIVSMRELLEKLTVFRKRSNRHKIQLFLETHRTTTNVCLSWP